MKQCVCVILYYPGIHGSISVISALYPFPEGGLVQKTREEVEREVVLSRRRKILIV